MVTVPSGYAAPRWSALKTTVPATDTTPGAAAPPRQPPGSSRASSPPPPARRAPGGPRARGRGPRPRAARTVRRRRRGGRSHRRRRRRHRPRRRPGHRRGPERPLRGHRPRVGHRRAGRPGHLLRRLGARRRLPGSRRQPDRRHRRRPRAHVGAVGPRRRAGAAGVLPGPDRRRRPRRVRDPLGPPGQGVGTPGRDPVRARDERRLVPLGPGRQRQRSRRPRRRLASRGERLHQGQGHQRHVELVGERALPGLDVAGLALPGGPVRRPGRPRRLQLGHHAVVVDLAVVRRGLRCRCRRAHGVERPPGARHRDRRPRGCRWRQGGLDHRHVRLARRAPGGRRRHLVLPAQGGRLAHRQLARVAGRLGRGRPPAVTGHPRFAGRSAAGGESWCDPGGPALPTDRPAPSGGARLAGGLLGPGRDVRARHPGPLRPGRGAAPRPRRGLVRRQDRLVDGGLRGPRAG
ncbi:hypothetical protein NOCARDAX2BIS_220014 [Nocardioides sp. AX2bis]|nr:hypothetical protein NOCARDAX2BIS_220014 [Nocardioides sp. AX2bis]